MKKEYGADFKKSYDKIANDLRLLTHKVRKRANFLKNQELPFENVLKNVDIEKTSTIDLISLISQIENQYVSQNKQGNLFDQ